MIIFNGYSFKELFVVVAAVVVVLLNIFLSLNFVCLFFLFVDLFILCSKMRRWQGLGWYVAEVRGLGVWSEDGEL